ncbi:MAG: TonB-dependent receptor [Proteobacteria bacterium]|nr:TonB-dependent receptor [Pseudomonadota bacterium]
MTPIRNLLSDAVRYGLAAGAVGFAGLASASAFAQDNTAPAPDSTKAKEVGRVEVIGSRIKRAVDTEPTAPVTTMTRADIAQTGLTSTFDVLNHITASDGTGLSTVTTQTNGSDGSTNVSLRGLGAQRTLVLVDGKRWPVDISGVVDLSSIPVAIIERVEVLKDGASTIYGSDAIAGVVNIITRKKFNGAQLNWSYGQTTHGDGGQESEDITIGANGERSSAVIGLSRSKQGTIFAGNRKLTNFPHFGCQALLTNYPASDPNGYLSQATSLGGCGSSSSQFGRFSVAGLGSMTLNNSFNNSGNASLPPASDIATAPGTKLTDYHHFGNLDRYNFAPVNYLQQPAVRNSLYASGHFDITDNVSAYARVSYTQRQSSQQLAQVPDGINRTSFGPQWVFFKNPDGSRAPLPAGSIFNPFSAAGFNVMDVRLRNIAIGPRKNNYDFNTLMSIGGLQGSFEVAGRNFDWDVYAQYNSERDTKIGDNYINLFNLKTAIGPSFADANGLHCGVYNPAAANNGAIQNCTPFNLFSGPNMGLGNSYTRADNPLLKYTVTAADVSAMLNYVRYTEAQADGNKGYNYGGNISGEILPLQGGMLQFAAGVEQRRSTSFFAPDALVAAGGSSDNFALPASGATKETAEYFEIDAPLLKNLPGAKELELDAAVRHSNDKASGLIGMVSPTGAILSPTQMSVTPGSPTTSKFSLRWKPIDDVLVRASYGSTFRAPSVFDLFAGQQQNFPNATDPCGTQTIAALPAAGQALCHAQGAPANGVAPTGSSQITALNGGNPLLKPERGHDLTFGVVISPSWDMLKGLNITVDYWKINLNNAITAFSAQTILNNCYRLNLLDNCALITRNPNGGTLANTNIVEFNANTLLADGIDFGLTYRKETEWGNFGVKWDSTYTHRNSTDGINSVGVYQGAPSWKWRSNFTLDWTRGDWDASWTMRYYSPMVENFGCSWVTDPAFGAPEAAAAGADPLICNHPNSTFTNNNFNPAVGSAVGLGGRLLGYNRVGTTVYHDVQVGWKAPWKAHVSLGVRNLFGKEPPMVASSFANSFDAAYDLPGGPFYYFQYRQDF